MKRYNVGKLNSQDFTSVRYLETVDQRLNDSWSENGTLEEKWQIVRDVQNNVQVETGSLLLTRMTHWSDPDLTRIN